MKKDKQDDLSKIEKAVLFITHTVCICVLMFCVWRSEELFPEMSAVAGDIQEQDNVATVVLPTGAPKVTQLPTLTPEPTQPATPTGEEGEKSELIDDKMEEGDKEALPEPSEQPEPVEPDSSEETAQAGEAENGVQPTQPAQPDENGLYAEVRAKVTEKIAQGVYQELDNTKYDWWFVRKNGHVPSAGGGEFDMSPYNGFYRNTEVSEEDKVIYLTFDCGYENGFTPRILDILAEHNAPAMFFVTKSFIKTCPDYVTRMKEEEYLVGNHTLNHPVMPTVDETTLMNEIIGCADLFYETTGYEMDPFLRPPTGAYSERTIALTKDLGYSTIFWSIAYKDYDPANQPGREYVIDHFATYYHNGAIPLIHNISQSNTEALDEVLTMLEEAGYRFGMLSELNTAEMQ